jgi:hypothetical protein
MSEATVRDMIQHALDQDFNKANEVFGEVMSVKMDDLLDQEKVALAAQVYNGVEPEDDDYDVGDDDVDQQDDADFEEDDEDVDWSEEELLDDEEDEEQEDEEDS